MSLVESVVMNALPSKRAWQKGRSSPSSARSPYEKKVLPTGVGYAGRQACRRSAIIKYFFH